MNGSTLLHLFLYLNLVIIGALITLAVEHAYAHFHPHHHDKKDADKQDGHLPNELRQQLIDASRANFQAVLQRSSAELQHDLTSTASQMTTSLEKIGTAVAEAELERYKADLEQLRKQTTDVLTTAQSSIASHQTELKTKLEADIAAERAKALEEVAAEKARLLQQLDTKLADAVASFLTETMQHEIDLGAQAPYLLETLKAHKDELLEGVTDER